MALQKPLRSIYGVDATYWIIKDVVMDRSRKMARITMGGYPTQDIRNEDTDPLMKLTINILFEKFDEFFNITAMNQSENNIYKIAYDAIKKHDSFFMDAQDI